MSRTAADENACACRACLAHISLLCSFSGGVNMKSATNINSNNHGCCIFELMLISAFLIAVYKTKHASAIKAFPALF